MVLAARPCGLARPGPEGAASARARLTEAASTSRKAAAKKTTVAYARLGRAPLCSKQREAPPGPRSQVAGQAGRGGAA